MSLILKRNQFLVSGIFGTLRDISGVQLAVTLEHSYFSGVNYRPKIPAGSYTCVRGKHRLIGMDHDFETFEITHVPGHSNILFHSGNFNRDSSGCILLGEKDNPNVGGMIINSKATFEKFMALMAGVQTFELLVVNRFDLDLQYS